MKIFLFIKEKSERLPNKNFLQLGGVELYKHTLLKLKDFEVYVDTDSKKIFKECNQDKNLSHVTCYLRNQEYIDYENNNEEISPALLITKNFLDTYITDENEPVILTHVTSPFLKVSTITDALKNLGKTYDSVCSVSEINSFILKKKDNKYEPINFDNNNVQKSQILDPIYNLNSAFFIFTKKTFELNNNNRLGKNPYYYKINFPEDLDINYPNDFKIAENLIDENNSKSSPSKTQRNIVSREYKKTNSIFEVSGVKFGGTHKPIIAGPCSVESKEQLFRIAKQVKKGGAHMLRGGAYKPRTSPYAFQGLKEEGLYILAEARDKFDLPFVTEVIDEKSALLASKYADMLQIGTRNMQNYSLLSFIGKLNKPVILKRGMCATLNEFLMSAEYLMSNGCKKVVLCERGIRSFSDHSRNILDIGIIPAIKRESHLPIIIDPSHAAGYNYSVIPHALAGLAAGADGLIVEVHDQPENALSDGPQALLPKQFNDLVILSNKITNIFK
tara:strand:- start:4422 stop:5927 length:1506 start_codon:yes stop_codon:yes gene_type:complete